MAQADWPSFQRDAQSTGLTDDVPGFESVWWKESVDRNFEASPIVHDDVVVLGSWTSATEGALTAYDLQSGTVLWTLATGKIVNTAAAEGGFVYAVDTTGLLQMIDLHKGTVQETATVGPTRGHITLEGGKLFVGNEAGDLYAFLTETLTLDWRFSVTTVGDTGNKTAGCGGLHPASPIRSAPAVYDGKVFFTTLSGVVYAVDEEGTRSGTTIQWIFQTGDAIWSSPTIDRSRNRVLVTSYDERVYSLATSTGSDGHDHCHGRIASPAWMFTVGNDGISKIHGSVATDGTSVVFGTNDGFVYSVDAQRGTQLWAAQAGADVRSSPAMAGNTVVLGADNGRVQFLNLTDGSERATYAMDSPVKSSPAVSGQLVVLASLGGELVVLGPELPTFPNLRVLSVTAERTGATMVIQNAGDAASGPTTVQLFANGALLAEIEVPGLAPGQTHRIEVPIDLRAGSYDLRAVVDPMKQVAEHNEFDNEATATVEVAQAARNIPGPIGLVALLWAALRTRAARAA